jgi:hypothetical protein
MIHKIEHLIRKPAKRATKAEMGARHDALFEIVEWMRPMKPRQFEDWELPTRPTNTTDSRPKKFGAESVERDSISPDRLRSIVKNAIERHLPERELEVLKAAEEIERQAIAALYGMRDK